MKTMGKMSNHNLLAEREGMVMEGIWKYGGATIEDLIQWMGVRYHLDLKCPTIQTITRSLVRKGYVTRQKKGKAYLYIPLRSRKSYEEEGLRYLVETVFYGSTEKLFSMVLTDHHTPEEILEYKQIVEAAIAKLQSEEESN